MWAASEAITQRVRWPLGVTSLGTGSRSAKSNNQIRLISKEAKPKSSLSLYASDSRRLEEGHFGPYTQPRPFFPEWRFALDCRRSGVHDLYITYPDRLVHCSRPRGAKRKGSI